MVEYKYLKQTHTDYDATELLKQRLLFSGGKAMKDNAHLFLDQLDCESHNNYQERLKSCAYIPYVGGFVDHYRGLLFRDDMQVVEAADSDDTDTLGSKVSDQ